MEIPIEYIPTSIPLIFPTSQFLLPFQCWTSLNDVLYFLPEWGQLLQPARTSSHLGFALFQESTEHGCQQWAKIFLGRLHYQFQTVNCHKLALDSRVYCVLGSVLLDCSSSIETVNPPQQIRKGFFTERAVGHWDRLPRTVVMAPSLMKFKKRLENAFRCMV